MEKKITFYKQIKPNTCGHAIMQMLISSLTGNIVTQSELIKRTELLNHGISLYEMRIILEEYDFMVQSFATTSKDMIYKIPFKKSYTILLLEDRGFSHFVLITKEKFGRVLVYDPSKDKEEWVKLDDLKEKWLLVFCTVSENTIIRKRAGDDENLSMYFKNTPTTTKSVYFFLFTSFLLTGVLSFLQGYSFRIIFNNAISLSQEKTLVILVFSFLLLLILQKILDIFLIRVMSIVKKKLVSFLISTLSKKLFNTINPNERKMEILESFSELIEFANARVFLKCEIPYRATLSLGCFIALILIRWEIGLAILGITILTLFIIFLFSLKKKKLVLSEKTKRMDFLLHSSLTIENFTELVYSNSNDSYLKKLNDSFKEHQTQVSNLQLQGGNVRTIVAATIGLTSILIYLVGGFLILDGFFGLQELITALMLSSYFWFNMSFVFELSNSSLYNSLKFVKLSMLNIKFHTKTAIIRKVNDVSLFHKQTGFRINKSERVLVKGKNGVGKTTLLRSLLIYSSKAKINNKTIKGSINHLVTYLNHNVPLLNGLLIDNVLSLNGSCMRIFMKNYEKYNLEALLKSVGLDLKSRVDMNGNNLSQGQMQFINILRIFTKSHEILILDEAMNSLQKHLEKKILEKISSWIKNSIFLVVSHSNESKELFTRELLLL